MRSTLGYEPDLMEHAALERERALPARNAHSGLIGICSLNG